MTTRSERRHHAARVSTRTRKLRNMRPNWYVKPARKGRMRKIVCGCGCAACKPHKYGAPPRVRLRVTDLLDIEEM